MRRRAFIALLGAAALARSAAAQNARKVYRLGDKVRVQVARVDMERRQIELALADVLQAVRDDERRRGPARSQARPKKAAAARAAKSSPPAGAGKGRRRASRPGKRERATGAGKKGRR